MRNTSIKSSIRKAALNQVTLKRWDVRQTVIHDMGEGIFMYNVNTIFLFIIMTI